MLRTLHKIITGLIVALGMLHVFVTFVDYDEFSFDALWFAGSGLAIILAGFLNLVLLRDSGKDRIVWLLCLLTNFVFAVMFGAVLFLMRQPQVFLGMALFAAASIISLMTRQWST